MFRNDDIPNTAVKPTRYLTGLPEALVIDQETKYSFVLTLHHEVHQAARNHDDFGDGFSRQ
jgi:hypothetical protein